MIPKALGGGLQIDRVCIGCNKFLGHQVDAALANHIMIWMKRGVHSLSGHSGQFPDRTRRILGGRATTTTDGFEHPVVVKASDAAGITDLYIPPTLEATYDVATGATTLRGIFDARDEALLERRVESALRSAGVPDEALRHLLEQVEVKRGKSKPELSYSQHVDLPDLSRAIAKIAYELTWRWLGEAYLDTLRASELRSLIRNGHRTVDIAASPENLRLCDQIGKREDEHLAILMNSGGTFFVLIELFSIFQGAVRTTEPDSAFCLPTNHIVRFSLNETYRDTSLGEMMSEIGLLSD